MPVAVHRDLVTGGDDLARERRPLLDLLADEEERRRRAARARAPRAPPASPAHAGPSSNVTATTAAVDAAVESQRGPRAAARAPRAPARTSRLTRRARARARPPRAARRARGPARAARSSAPRSARSRSRSRADDLGDPVAPERRVVDADVPAAPAVGDRRAAAHVRLEHGQPAGRVDERVARREPLAHLLGEADHPHARLAGVARTQPRAQLLVAAAEARDDGRRPSCERRVDRALEVADAPASAGDEHDLAVGGQAERRARRERVARPRELRPRQPVHDLRRRSPHRRPRAPPRSTRDESRGAGRLPARPSSASPPGR